MDFTTRNHPLVLRKAHQMASAFESVNFEIPTKDGVVEQALDLADFPVVRERLATLISIEGKAALGLVPYFDYKNARQTYLPVPMSVYWWRTVGAQELHVVCVTNQQYYNQSAQQTFNVYARYYFNEEAQPVYETFHFFDTESFDPENAKNIRVIESITLSHMKVLPVKIFKNNFEMISDVEEYGAEKYLKELVKFENDRVAQYERSKNLFYANQNYTNQTAQDVAEEIDNGKGAIDEMSMNSKAGGGIQMLTQSAGFTINTAAVMSLTDTVSKTLGLSSNDSQSTLTGGAQKHSLEIVIKDQFSLEELIRKFNMREKQWTDFFYILCTALKAAIITPTLKPSALLEAKMDYLKAASNTLATKPVNNMQGQLQNQNQSQQQQEDGSVAIQVGTQ